MGGALPADVFAIDGAADPLLVVQVQEIPAVGTGQIVEVTGTVKETSNAITVEEELEVAPEGEPHPTATRVEIVERWVPPAAAGVERIIRHETCPAPGDPAEATPHLGGAP